jgi:hypothetical protein
MSEQKLKEAELIELAPKAIVHLRAQHRAKRLGLLFGAGISINLGYPRWEALVKKIAARAEVGAIEIWDRLEAKGAGGRPITRSLASITQMLFSEFRERRIVALDLGPSLTFVQERSIKTDWLRLLHEELYQGLDATARKERLAQHPYLNAFTNIIKQSPLTVTYNFDDTLEQMLALARSGDESETSRGYEMIDRPNSQFRRRDSVVYHPNGCLPAVFENGASADVVFADDSFQDQLISAANGKYIHLSGHLFRNTCLLIGLSLEDYTLQSLLRQNAVQNPGNVHYIVQYIAADTARDSDAEAVIFKANFESFGLYTLFLNDEEIRTLATLIEMDTAAFSSRHAKLKPKFVYYMIGSVGAGKSTAAGNFRSLITYDEWIDERKPDLARPEGEVSTDKISGLNEWIAEQFHKKNFALQDCKEGVHVIDRAPLDPLTFGPKEDRNKKAKALLEKITGNGALEVAPGHIIQLSASLEEIRIRNSLKHKYWPDDEYEKLLREIEEVYGGLPKSVICTTGRSAAEVAKHVARIIFLGEYQPVNIQDELSNYAAAAQTDAQN